MRRLPREARDGLMRAWLQILREKHPGVTWVAAVDDVGRRRSLDRAYVRQVVRAVETYGGDHCGRCVRHSKTVPGCRHGNSRYLGACTCAPGFLLLGRELFPVREGSRRTIER
jgi:hypothetical protein